MGEGEPNPHPIPEEFKGFREPPGLEAKVIGKRMFTDKSKEKRNILQSQIGTEINDPALALESAIREMETFDPKNPEIQRLLGLAITSTPGYLIRLFSGWLEFDVGKDYDNYNKNLKRVHQLYKNLNRTATDQLLENALKKDPLSIVDCAATILDLQNPKHQKIFQDACRAIISDHPEAILMMNQENRSLVPPEIREAVFEFFELYKRKGGEDIYSKGALYRWRSAAGGKDWKRFWKKRLKELKE